MKKQPIAVVSMAGVFPGASDLDIFWEHIVNKVSSVCEVPEDRWIAKPDVMYDPELKPDKAYSTRACLIRDFAFDPEGFRLDSALLSSLDPLYQILLHTGRDAFSNCITHPLNKERIGVILAAIALPTDSSSAITRRILGRSFEQRLFPDTPLAPDRPLTVADYLSSRVTSLPAALLSEALGLGGGSFTLDAACASSLYAVKLACDQLQSYRADAVLAGGVSRPDCLYTQVGFSQLQALSPSGRCAPFDESADGLVVGEGAGIMMLKRLDDALRDGDSIYGIIRSIGLSNDIRGNLLAPDTDGQIRAMENAYRNCGWKPQDVDLIECHGTGTPTGDRAELQSMGAVWGDAGWTPHQCAIGSVKSMIGHMLTGAGAAGMIKTLLALKHETLPPSLNFTKAPANSPLADGPFRVQTSAEHWKQRASDIPRRAAVSAFGFGGINAHLLIEQWNPDNIENRSTASVRYSETVETDTARAETSPTPPEIAIIGMNSAFGAITSLKKFQEAVLNGESAIGKRPSHRWKGAEATAAEYLNTQNLHGAFLNDLSLYAGEFHIPPREIPDILPQHLLMLKVAAGAMKDAGQPLRDIRPQMGTIVGMSFDMEATNFHLRWNLHNQVRLWAGRLGLDPDDDATLQWLDQLKDQCGGPLTATRTLGALGGIIASRIAREFRFGGPSFVVSAEEASGLKALEIGVRFLQNHEADAMLIGAVDTGGDVRQLIMENQIRPFSETNRVRPFDQSADGRLPGEGAVALVLKRLDQAIADGDRIYSVIKGIGSAFGIETNRGSVTGEAYVRSMNSAFEASGVSPDAVSFMETHGSGVPEEDAAEARALFEVFGHRKEPCGIGSAEPVIGSAGAASALASIVKTSVCLYQEIIPPLPGFSNPKQDVWQKGAFHIPVHPQYWFRNRADGPRKACVSAMTIDGNCMHVVLEGYDGNPNRPVSEKVETERIQPLGMKDTGLFVVEADSKNQLLDGLESLNRFIQSHHGPDRRMEQTAFDWYHQNGHDPKKPLALSLVAGDMSRIKFWMEDAGKAIVSDSRRKINGGPGGICYSPEPLGAEGGISFVFPGSGNHYVGMGREIGTRWPEVLRKMDTETLHLKTQMIPACYMPWRSSWMPGWEKEAEARILSDPHHMIFGQEVHGGVMTHVISQFGIRPSSCIGYSLGESAGLFALGAWPDRGRMLERMLETDLFTTELAGPCHAARKAWNIPAGEPFNWCVAVVNRPADEVKSVIGRHPLTRLLIINTPDECVIGGMNGPIRSVIKALGCDAFFLDGVVTVHCDAALPAKEAYKALHVFPTTAVDGIRFYSCAQATSYDLTSEAAAQSILNQALYGFDFTRTIDQAYADGNRIFLELGPRASCTRMIRQIIGKRPHLAVSACVRGEDDYVTILKCLGALVAERVPVDLDRLLPPRTYDALSPKEAAQSKQVIALTIGGRPPSMPLPPRAAKKQNPKRQQLPEKPKSSPKARQESVAEVHEPMSPMLESFNRNMRKTAEAHQEFLELSNRMKTAYGKACILQNRLLAQLVSSDLLPAGLTDQTDQTDQTDPADKAAAPPPAFSREMCMEFATGSLAAVLGPEFAVVDTYNARVRLPDEPLMLVDRIMSVDGEKGSLASGKLVTEHDVLPGAWYLDGGHAPVCISVEAGQADLFLCSYLGIDRVVKGKRTYRLLDARVRFHRGLPKPGDTIRYEISISKFIRQGDTYMFFFNYEGRIGNEPLITMTDGCAGFFTEEEVQNSGGIILTAEDTCPLDGKKPGDWTQLVPVAAESYDDRAIEALREGNPAACFGPDFDGIRLPESIKLPGGRMHLVDRVLSIDPAGGRYGIGQIRAQADIHPDDWFLTCHFVDDKVMPGTLMYECCCHTLRIFLQRIGWISE
ncbi:MAG: beta-ketoacyl synthase N-terminal-like domain-containing protein, partial [Desulfobacterales bacterium]|nr:beta-ketoacyl synthase N-terminal-like domain-containing protein [Desulfobacterales bacterium]